MYFSILFSFFNEREPFSKTWGRNKQQKLTKIFKRQFLGYILNLFMKKWGVNGVCALIHPIKHAFDTAYAENLQKV